MKATLRYRGGKGNLVELAKKLDAFKKVPEKYTETTEIGGTLSLLSQLLIILLIYNEVRYYQEANLVFQFEPDIDMDDKVPMHVDMTVAMPCESLSGVDLMDETQQDVFGYGTLQREGTWWNMNAAERSTFKRMQIMNSFLREEYHSVADVLFKDIINSKTVLHVSSLNDKPLAEMQYDACRLHGTIGINKVAGVLHLVGGAEPVFDVFQDHWMIEFKPVQTNFTHRIHRLSFGQYSNRIVQPLEGDETLVADESTTVQYFLKIVPTVIHNTFSTINTFQYSVTENLRKLDPNRNSYGSPGIYIKYDWSALKIVVRTDRDTIMQFIIRLCSIISGIIVISSILNSLLVTVQRKLFTMQSKVSQQRKVKAPPTTTASANEIATSSSSATMFQTNDLIMVANEMAADSLTNNGLPKTLFLPVSNVQQL